MEKREIKIDLNTAKALYNAGGLFKELSLSAFNEEELYKEPKCIEIQIDFGKVYNYSILAGCHLDWYKIWAGYWKPYTGDQLIATVTLNEDTYNHFKHNERADVLITINETDVVNINKILANNCFILDKNLMNNKDIPKFYTKYGFDSKETNNAPLLIQPYMLINDIRYVMNSGVEVEKKEDVYFLYDLSEKIANKMIEETKDITTDVIELGEKTNIFEKIMKCRAI